MISLTYNDPASGRDFYIKVIEETVWITYINFTSVCCGNNIFIEDIKKNNYQWKYIFDIDNGYPYPLELKLVVERIIKLKAFE